MEEINHIGAVRKLFEETRRRLVETGTRNRMNKTLFPACSIIKRKLFRLPSPDGPALKERITSLKSTRDQARVRRACQQEITPAMLHRFALAARERMRLPGGGYRRDHLRALA